MNLAAESAWLARQIAEYPLLLDELLDARLFDTPPTRESSRTLFGDDLERRGAERRRGDARRDSRLPTHRAFRIAIADRLGSLPLMK